MSKKKRRGMPFSLRELMIKMAIMTVTVGIGLWCGWSDSYSAFYIAVLVQAVNNLYDASAYLGGFNRLITIFQTLAFIGALAAAVFAIIHFTPHGNFVDTPLFVFGIVIALSIPILHILIEMIDMIIKDRY